MRKTALEQLQELEIRVAQLEKNAFLGGVGDWLESKVADATSAYKLVMRSTRGAWGLDVSDKGVSADLEYMDKFLSFLSHTHQCDYVKGSIFKDPSFRGSEQAHILRKFNLNLEKPPHPGEGYILVVSDSEVKKGTPKGLVVRFY